jgi:hypothetical protein
MTILVFLIELVNIGLGGGVHACMIYRYDHWKYYYMLDLIISTPIMGNPNPNPTRYKIKQMHGATCKFYPLNITLVSELL